MIVTVMSDASFCHTTGASGWGVWMKSLRGKFECGGNFKKTKPLNAGDAEAMAVSIAVFAAFKSEIAIEGDKLLIQSDCLQVVDMLNGKAIKRSAITKKAIQYTLKEVQKRKCTIEARHVKAHVSKEKGERRNYVNNVCDKLARKAMKTQRKELAPK